ncbi:uncharacterized protein KQ657_004116 [Scheffersomyces spartinae]|uniref:Endonuclease/exonuclease/phosphatase domain-containing protein n=1 Tax=Scheffersomyces spartinae TaxID=45513 RepID=A0A9P7VBN8_9ASCO|nr:uncharacterized protein KQ657_004116 [Scheffersomyces spartinae]KAG7195004.1 hypothetical protein KQ657_004116 [Scheffersomyces spartinae]
MLTPLRRSTALYTRDIRRFLVSCIASFGSNSLGDNSGLPRITPSVDINPVIPPLKYDATRFRNWLSITPNSDPINNISVFSYNLLSRHYVWRQVFGYLDQLYLDWTNYRFPLLNNTIRQLQSDIMCFQEMECFMYEHFWSTNFPGPNYKSFFIRKPNPKYWGNKPSEFMDGVGIFINTDRFEILDQLEVIFSEFIKDNRKQFDWTDDLMSRVIPRNTVALLVKLHDKISDKIVFVTNTHLYWSPKFNDVKVIQTKLLLSILNEFIANSKGQNVDDPCVILCGDFNSTPTSKVFELLSNENLHVDKCDELGPFDYGKDNYLVSENGYIKNPFRLQCVYQHLLNDNSLQFTSYTKALTEVLDHIWINNDHFNIVDVLGPVEKNYSDKVNGFPNNQFPSDHIPLVSTLCYI